MPTGNLINNVSQIRLLQQLQRGEIPFVADIDAEDSVERTVASKLNETISVDDFGADPTGETDSTDAINAAFAYVRNKFTSQTGAANTYRLKGGKHYTVNFTGLYLCLGSINATAINKFRTWGIKFEPGAGIISCASGKVAFDMYQSRFCKVEGLQIYGHEDYIPSVGLFVSHGLASATAGCGEHFFYSCEINGFYSVAALYDYASESTSFLKCFFRNGYEGEDADSVYSAIFTARNISSITSDFLTVLNPSVGQVQSFNGTQVLNSEFTRSTTGLDNHNHGTGPAILLDGVKTFHMFGYARQAGVDNPIVTIKASVSARNITLNLMGERLAADPEVTDFPNYLFDPDPGVTLRDIEIIDHNLFGRCLIRFGSDCLDVHGLRIRVPSFDKPLFETEYAGNDPALMPMIRGADIVDTSDLEASYTTPSINLDILRGLHGTVQSQSDDFMTGSLPASRFAGMHIGEKGSAADNRLRIKPPSSQFDDFPAKVYRSSGDYCSDFDWSVPKVFDDATIYYVDPVSGDNANAGTSPALPLKGTRQALLKTGKRRILIRGGTGYLARDSDHTLDFDWGPDPVSLEGWGAPVKLLNSNNGSALTWTSDGDGVYHATLNQVHGVLYTAAADPNIAVLPQALSLRADVAAAKAAAEGWLTDGTTVWAKIPPGTTPQVSSVKLIRNTGMDSYLGLNLYMRNVWWIGFGKGIRHVPLVQEPTARFTAVDCLFSHTDQAGSYNCVGNLGVGLSALKNCQAYYGGKDNFNYHARTESDTQTYIIEEGCTSKYTAWNYSEPRGPYQASTIHDGMKVLRINGTYGPTLGGPCVQDQGADDKVCYAWSVGCTMDAAGSPTSIGELSVNWGYAYLGGALTNSWLEECTLLDGGSGPVHATTTGNRAVRIRGGGNTWAIAPTGDVGPY